jgi:pilus assembly protein CpaC
MFSVIKGPATKLFYVALFAAFALLVHRGDALAQGTVSTQLDSSRYAGEFAVAVNKSQILKVDQPFSDLLVGNDKIADVIPLTNRTVYILGKQLGTTSLSVYGKGKSLLAIVDLVVTHNIDSLKRRIFDLFPEEKVEVRSVNDSVALSGMVSSGARVGQIVALAERYAPGKVTNLLKAKGSQQVMLAVRFAEVKRSAFKELGINSLLLGESGDATFSLLNLFPGAAAATGVGTLAEGTFSGGEIAVLLDALERKGIVKTLAEPNLIALSGDTANFLAGGEFPIPVAQDANSGGSTITVEFKPFGVSLAFTPTVLHDALISLEVRPEVSSVDSSASITAGGLTVPGLTTRRAHTTVELKDGQSFAIAGLLQSELRDGIRQLPFAGDIPILGALFRSTDFQRDETELVIIVTPHLVKPARKDELALPTDFTAPPSDLDLFLLGRLETTPDKKPDGKTKGHLVFGADSKAGGLDGTYGHIIK